MSALKQTDLSKRIRLAINANGVISRHDTLAAADEIDRYYTGMLNWKATAEAKDANYTRPAPACEATPAPFDEAKALELAHDSGIRFEGGLPMPGNEESLIEYARAILRNFAPPTSNA